MCARKKDGKMDKDGVGVSRDNYLVRMGVGRYEREGKSNEIGKARTKYYKRVRVKTCFLLLHLIAKTDDGSMPVKTARIFDLSQYNNAAKETQKNALKENPKN